MEESISQFISREYPSRQSVVGSHIKLSHKLVKPSSWVDRTLGSKLNRIMTGSTEEFFIHPFRSCIGDFDSMIYNNYDIVFSDDNPQLEGDIREFAANITCYKIMPYQKFPGFVRLLKIGWLVFNLESNGYEFTKTSLDRQCLTTRNAGSKEEICSTHDALSRFGQQKCFQFFGCSQEVTKIESSFTGPALTYEYGLHYDRVDCLRCLSWPNEANEWLLRERQSGGWPTEEVIAEVVKQGCHLVPAKHPSCPGDIFQWRYSFSKAEIILINSWTKTQQTLFHMLRYFAKQVLIKAGSSKSKQVLCTYHLKTLMLWTCEEQLPDWWESSNVIEICCILLQKLSGWLQARHCPNYFIRKANLFGDHQNRKIVQETVDLIQNYVDSESLAYWFATCYLELDSLIEFHDGYYTTPLPTVTNNGTYGTLWNDQYERFEKEFTIVYVVLFQSPSEKNNREEFSKFAKAEFEWYDTSKGWNTNFEKKKLDSVAPWLFHFAKLTLLFCLETLFQSGASPNDDELIDLIKDIFVRNELLTCNNFPASYPHLLDKEHVQLIEAEELMSGLNDCHSKAEFEFLRQMSIESLRKSFSIEISDSSVFRVASVYMAALHYAGGQFDSAVDFCSAALQINTTFSNSSSSQRDSKLNGQILLYIDDAANAIGFLLLFRYIRSTTNQDNITLLQNIVSGLFFSPELFANYLMISCKAFTFIPQLSEKFGRKYQPDICLLAISRFQMSEHLRGKHSPSKSCLYSRDGLKPFQSASEQCLPTNKKYLVHLIMGCCLEYITSFCGHVKSSFGIPCYTDKCYRALYMYQRERYEDVLTMCEKILMDPEPKVFTSKFAFMNVIVLPPFLDFFDGDINALLGMRILYWNILHRYCFKRNPSVVSGPSLRVSDLVYAGDFKQVHFVRSHFLAHYLILRCKMDCGRTKSEILAQFRCLTPRLQLEEQIVCFMRCRYLKRRKTLA